MTDRVTKMLMLAIALGLWMNVIGEWARPVSVQAQSVDLSEIERYLRGIHNGVCINGKIC